MVRSAFFLGVVEESFLEVLLALQGVLLDFTGTAKLRHQLKLLSFLWESLQFWQTQRLVMRLASNFKSDFTAFSALASSKSLQMVELMCLLVL